MLVYFLGWLISIVLIFIVNRLDIMTGRGKVDFLPAIFISLLSWPAVSVLLIYIWIHLVCSIVDKVIGMDNVNDWFTDAKSNGENS